MLHMGPTDTTHIELGKYEWDSMNLSITFAKSEMSHMMKLRNWASVTTPPTTPMFSVSYISFGESKKCFQHHRKNHDDVSAISIYLKMPFYYCGYPHNKTKMVLWRSYLYNGSPYTWEEGVQIKRHRHLHKSL